MGNAALLAVPGAPRTSGKCTGVQVSKAEGVQACCALCLRRPQCSAWSFYAPSCYISSECESGLTDADASLMWGAVSGVRISSHAMQGLKAASAKSELVLIAK